MTGIGARAISALILAAALGFVFWLRPDLEPGMLGASTPEQTMAVFTGLFAMFWAYLVIQGYPISHGFIGSSSTHNLDNIVSGIPAIVALFGIFRPHRWILATLLPQPVAGADDTRRRDLRPMGSRRGGREDQPPDGRVQGRAIADPNTQLDAGALGPASCCACGSSVRLKNPDRRSPSWRQAKSRDSRIQSRAPRQGPASRPTRERRACRQRRAAREPSCPSARP